MNIRKWVWCLGCERAFEVYLSLEPTVVPPPPDVDEPPVYPFAYEFEVQLGGA